jgi:hypothetical protein
MTTNPTPIADGEVEALRREASFWRDRWHRDYDKAHPAHGGPWKLGDASRRLTPEEQAAAAASSYAHAAHLPED